MAAMDAIGIDYMLVGSLSTNYYGIPRSTKDADFVVQLDRVPVEVLMQKLGAAFTIDPQMSFE